MSSLLSRICQLSKDTLRLFKPSRELFTYTFFLILSGIIWLAVSLNEYYDREVTIPVLITGVPESVALDDGVEDTIRATIHDKGFSLLYYVRSNKEEPLKIDFKTYKKSSGQMIVSNSDLKRLVNQYIEGTGTVSAVKPEKLEYAYSECITKIVPVRLAGKIETAENYYLAQSIIEPNKVKIYLSKSLADQVKFVTTEDLNVTNLSDTTTIETSIKSIKGVNISTKKVTVHLLADILTEEEIEAPITAVNVPEGTTLRFFPPRVKVKFVVGVSMLKNINPDEFVVQTDYNQIVQGSDKCTITVVQKPHGVVKANPEVSQVDYLIEN